MSTCCPKFPVTNGGILWGGSARYRVADDAYDGYEMVQPLNETATGAAGDYQDRTIHDLDGRGGDATDPDLVPDVDDGVFCLPSQHFDGRQFITLDSDNMITTQPFAVSMWAKVETYYKPRRFFSRGNFAFGYDFLNRLDAICYTADMPDDDKFCTGSTALSQNQWYHVAANWKPGTGMKVFLNGVQDGSKAISETELAPAGASYLSRFGEPGSSSIEGNLQEVRLHPRERSAAWFLAEFENICDYENFLEFSGEENSSWH
ncbi:LamG domain-containing protein [Anatilimnocola floriformis]|uniref:LamG domain-containing protein n=1 Tax=Anatilimnocola floriformis TaxID=2948575 RepID=UPI0020C4CB06|nr:LamG domain-containing protein [Anatilimnocola floriformis]